MMNDQKYASLKGKAIQVGGLFFLVW